MDVWWRIVLGAVAGGLLAWAALVLVLWRVAPPAARVSDSVRLLPDLVRLIAGLARDTSLPTAVRLRLWLLVGYLAVPIDLVPDFIPVIGYADDAVVVVWVLGSTVRRAGTAALIRHWHGTPEGLAAARRLCGVADG